MKELIKAWEEEYKHLEDVKQTDVEHLQFIKINAKALQLKYCINALKKQLILSGVSKSFKVVDIDLFDYTQITIVNEKENYVVCHMYTMGDMDLDRVRKQAQTMCDALNVC
jgi:hypothetical protein